MTDRQFNAALDFHFDRRFSDVYDGPDDDRLQIWHAAAALRDVGYDVEEHETYLHVYLLDADGVGLLVAVNEQDDGEWTTYAATVPEGKKNNNFPPLSRRDEDDFLRDIRRVIERGA